MILDLCFMYVAQGAECRMTLSKGKTRLEISLNAGAVVQD